MLRLFLQDQLRLTLPSALAVSQGAALQKSMGLSHPVRLLSASTLSPMHSAPEGMRPLSTRNMRLIAPMLPAVVWIPITC